MHRNKKTYIHTNYLHIGFCSIGRYSDSLSFRFKNTVSIDPVNIIFGLPINARFSNPMMSFVLITWPHLVRPRHLVRPSPTVVVVVSFSTPSGFEKAKDWKRWVRFLLPVASHGVEEVIRWRIEFGCLSVGLKRKGDGNDVFIVK